MRIFCFVVSLVVSVLLSCRQATPEWQRAELPAVAEAGRPPVFAEVQEVALDAQRAEIEVVISKLVATEKDVSVDVQVPRGVVLEGSTTSKIGKDEKGLLRRRVVMTYPSRPAEDVVVVVDMQGTIFGVHAALPYRFGRSAPAEVRPVRSLEEVKAGDVSLGHPVQLGR